MVDFDAVLGEVKRTAYVGLGTFGSASLGNFLDENIPGGDMSVASAQVLAGAGGAYVVRDRMGGRETRGLDFDMGEAARHAAYGIGGSGFAEAADALTEDALFGGSSQGELVEVRSRSSNRRATTDGGNQSQNSSSSSEEEDEISVDV